MISKLIEEPKWASGLVNEALSEIHMGSYVDRMTDLISRKYLRDMAIDRNS